MQMSDAEILSSFSGAKDPIKQIGVLADLNCVKPAEMQRYLHEIGAPVELPKERKRKILRHPAPSFDVARALQLHAQGLCDLDIAEQLGIRQSTFAAWRRGQGLPANVRRPAKENPAKEAPGQPDASPASSTQVPCSALTVGRLAEIFSRIAQWHPNAPVTMDGKSVGAVMLSSVFDNTSDAEVACFLMEG